MGKQYLKFNSEPRFGSVSSNLSNLVPYLASQVFLVQYDQVVLFDLKLGKPILKFTTVFPEDSFSTKLVQVTQLCLNPKNLFQLTIGYSDGSIRIFDFQNLKEVVEVTLFKGHKSAVTQLVYDKLGQRLASGSKDSQIVLWDVVEEVGLLRLRGHTDEVTGIEFLTSEGEELLVSCSKDTQVKLFDLTTGHCLQTVLAHRNEVWSMEKITVDGQTYLVTGGTQVKFWLVDFTKLQEQFTAEGKVEVLQLKGNLEKSSKGKVTGILFQNNRLYIQGDVKFLEVFQLRSKEEIQKKLKRRVKRLNEKNKLDGVDLDQLKQLQVYDLFLPLTQLRVPFKINSFTVNPTDNNSLFLQFNVNLVTSYTLLPNSETKRSEYVQKYSLDRLGHRYEIKTASLSPNLELLLTCSLNQYLIWNLTTGLPVRNLVGTEPVSCLFLPGSKHVVVGTKLGKLELYDVNSNQLLETIDAHDDAVTGIVLLPSQDGILTCGLDRQLKQFTFVTKTLQVDPDESIHLDLVHPNQKVRQLSLSLQSSLELDEGCLCLAVSPDSKLVALGLLDSTVKVFYLDTFKLYLNLYGHKLPVNCVDISSDSHLIVTGSNDKNVKVWGLDFGDCHKSLFAHTEAVTQTRFLQGTHLILSSSNDGDVKIWDGDTFQMVQHFTSHFSKVSALLTGETPQLFVSVSYDRSVVKFERSDEPLFLDEEKEKALDKLLDANLLQDIQNETELDSNQVSLPTSTSLKSGEKLVAAIDLANQDLEEGRLHKLAYPNSNLPRQRHPILQLKNIDPHRYVLDQILSLPKTQLEDTLLLLPLTYILHLVDYLQIWTQNNWYPPLLARITNFILQLHYSHITNNLSLKAKLVQVKNNLRYQLGLIKDVMGYNLAALHFLHQQIQLESNDFLEEPDLEEKLELKRGSNSSIKRKVVV